MAVGIPTGFVRKLYRILDHESAAILGWDASGASFSILDAAALDAQVLPRYFRGRLSAFRQQLLDHGFARCDCEEDDEREQYRHPDFLKGQPGRLSKIERKPKRNAKTRQNNVETPKPQQHPISLKVTLTMPPRKRPRVQEQHEAKRLKTQTVAPKKTKNPLFSDDPEPGAMSLAKFVEGTGLLPASSELPDPISYLNKLSKDPTKQSAAAPQQTQQMGPMFSDDMVKSALFFLVSSSCTGLESNAVATGTTTDATALTTATTATVAAAAPLPTAAATSTSNFLASLLASSSTGGTTATPFTRGTNPLFSDQATDGDDDSIWNILVSSSVDRVRTAMSAVESPQEKLRLILEEREKLEEQRKKVGAPAGPIVPKSLAVNGATAATENSRPQKQQNPLFAADTGGSGVEGRNVPAEDDLWKLLMSSSVDAFRRVNGLGF